MALQAISDEGHLHWRCHHAECPPQHAHLSHEQVEWVDGQTVALPPCRCGSRTYLKVVFTEEELQAPNMLEYGLVPVEMELPHAETGQPVKVRVPQMKPVGMNPVPARHQRLAELLHAADKHPPQVER